jgi:hypothetical protein
MCIKLSRGCVLFRGQHSEERIKREGKSQSEEFVKRSHRVKSGVKRERQPERESKRERPRAGEKVGQRGGSSVQDRGWRARTCEGYECE